MKMLSDDDLRAIVRDDALTDHRKRALTPDAPVVRGTAHNPDTYFQAREACNPYYDACAEITQAAINPPRAPPSRRKARPSATLRNR